MCDDTDLNADDDRVDIQLIEDSQWVVVRTKSRGEKKVLEYCHNHAVTAYLPLRRSVRHYAKRTVEFMVPIFTGYVFCQIGPDELITINGCHNTARVIRPSRDMEIQLISELRNIQIFEKAMAKGEITVKPEISVGNVIIIKTGPFAGLSGVVKRWKTKVRMTVAVEMVGQSATLEVDANEVAVDY